MTTLYLVTTGDYSDYEVRGVFSTPEKAEHAKRLWDGNDIETIVLDALPEHPEGMYPFYVSISPLKAEAFKTNCESIEGRVYFYPSLEVACHGYPAITKRDSVVTVWARDEAHAIKIASEKRVQAIQEYLLSGGE